ncbi:myrosinase 1-like [Neodiprion fabricii]|uniref:myrosinase 1-like n=1 Tax=Neodiprion fabricii TaxID=2872261 RepID=UPI001ED93AA7|nr:myrosinase 1-like [Neodiprion fabricii]XP_046416667.1 myrosinase 1-like [Neodiprion fabricii]
MKYMFIILTGCVAISKISCHEVDSLTFPTGMLFGAATSAFQTEGAWNVSDKGVSNWDYWTHQCPQCIADGNNIEITCNSYYKYKEDVALLKKIGFNYYRFSISWTRILPHGLKTKVNRAGIEHYLNLTKTLIANGIEPMVTIYHFDHPQTLEDMGGWMNKHMVKWFAQYARIIFKELGPYVKIFTTINEPQKLCQGYEGNSMSPGKSLLDYGEYTCITNVLKAHATAYHIYDKEFRETQGGQIGITNPCDGFVFDETNDTISADIGFQFGCGVIGHPIYKGDFSKVMKERIANYSKAEDYPESRLPTLTEQWISFIKGSSDYFGLNHYSSVIWLPDPNETPGRYSSDSGLIRKTRPEWITGSDSTTKIVPEGFGNLLRKIKEEYDNPLVYVTENGFPDHGEMKDYDRIKYYRTYMEEMFKAVKRDGCRVERYTIWSLMDNFELNSGYAARFGIIKVNFTSPNRERTPKLSASWWKFILRTHKLHDLPRKYAAAEQNVTKGSR